MKMSRNRPPKTGSGSSTRQPNYSGSGASTGSGSRIGKSSAKKHGVPSAGSWPSSLESGATCPSSDTQRGAGKCSVTWEFAINRRSERFSVTLFWSALLWHPHRSRSSAHSHAYFSARDDEGVQGH